jgi:hypothetical protein
LLDCICHLSVKISTTLYNNVLLKMPVFGILFPERNLILLQYLRDRGFQ